MDLITQSSFYVPLPGEILPRSETPEKKEEASFSINPPTKYPGKIVQLTSHWRITEIVLPYFRSIASFCTDYFENSHKAEQQAEMHADNPEQKEEQLKKALEIASPSEKWKYRLLLSQFYYETGRVEEALEFFPQLDEKKKPAGAHFLEGLLLMWQENFTLSYLSLQRAFEKDSSESGKAAADFERRKIVALFRKKNSRSLEEQCILAMHEALFETHSITECMKLFSREDFSIRDCALKKDHLLHSCFKPIFNYIRRQDVKDPLVQERIGDCFLFQSYYGVGSPTWHGDVAFPWYKKAAEQGLATAQFRLGQHYYNLKREHRWEEHEREELKWIKKAAEQRNFSALEHLCDHYSRQENYEELVKWSRRAAEQDNFYGQFRLADCYLRGLGIEKNLQEAARWAKKAIDNEQKSEADLLYRRNSKAEEILHRAYCEVHSIDESRPFLKQALQWATTI